METGIVLVVIVLSFLSHVSASSEPATRAPDDIGPLVFRLRCAIHPASGCGGPGKNDRLTTRHHDRSIDMYL